MKHGITLMSLIAMFYTTSTAQVHQRSIQVKKGDLFEIGDPYIPRYKYIHFPSPNFIVKRGGIPNYSNVKNKIVVVIKVKRRKDGSTKIKLKRRDGGRFFGTHTVVSARLPEALKFGELYRW